MAGTLATAGDSSTVPYARTGRLFDVVLFDIDDTLYDVGDLAKSVWTSHAGDLSRLGLDAATFCAAYDTVRPGRGLRAAVTATLTHLEHELRATDVERVIKMATACVPTSLPLRPGAEDLLRLLRGRGIRVGAVTNGTSWRQHAKVAALGIDDLVEVVVVGGDDGVPAKPSPAPFLKALAALGGPAERVLMVGDRPDVDVAPAVALGMGAVRLVAGHYAALPAAPGALVDTGDPSALWQIVADATADLT